MSRSSSNGLHDKSVVSNPDDDESNQSFVRKVKSRVTGLIPSSLSKWFGSDEKKPAVRLREDDDDEEVQIQPPLKRVKLPSSTGDNLSCYTAPVVFLPPARSYNAAGPSHGNSFYNGDDRDSESGESTSGYSSIAKAAAAQERRTTDDEVIDVINANQLFNSSSFGHNRSLFMDTSHGNTSLSSRRPSFNTSTFGSPSFVDRTLSTQRIMNSPFYNGCTMYGGAAAHNKPRTPKVQVKPINETAQKVNRSATLGKTARRILDTINQYSTDVSKIPHPLRDKPISAKYSGANPYIIREHRVSTTELRVPTVPDLLKMKLKERLQDSTEAVRHIAATSKSAQNEYQTDKHTNKIRNKISSIRQKPESEAPPPTKLPEIALPIATLPKFDFSFPLPTSSLSKPVTVVSCATKPQTPPLILPPPLLLEFKFADPLVLAENIKSIIAINDFKFSDPVIFTKLNVAKLIESASDFKPSKDSGRNDKLKSAVSESPKSACVTHNGPTSCTNKQCVAKTPPLVSFDAFKMKNDQWECSVCMVRNSVDKIKCAACETPKAGGATVQKTLDAFKLKSGQQWECGVCMVRNPLDKTKCAACETPKMEDAFKTGNSVKVAAPKTDNLDAFKMKGDQWECSVCMVRNASDKTKCAACETPKQGSTSTQKPSLDAFKRKSDEWECSVCMVRNTSDKTKCAACETPKPGETKTSISFGVKTTAEPKFTFGIPPSFGDKPATTLQKESSKVNAATSEATTTFKFGVKTTPSFGGKSAKSEATTAATFSFGKTTSSLGVTSETPEPKSTFSFGTKTNAATSAPGATSTFSFGAKPTAVPETTPAFGFGTKTTESATPKPTFTFGNKTIEVTPTFGVKTATPNTAFGVTSTETPTLDVKSTTDLTTNIFGDKNVTSKRALEPEPITPKKQNRYFVSSPTAFTPPEKEANNSNGAASVFPSKPLGFEAAKPSLFETALSPPKPIFESPEFPTTTTPSFTFGAPKPGGFSFAPTNESAPFNFASTTSSSGFNFNPQSVPTSTPVFNFSAPKQPLLFGDSNAPVKKNIFEASGPVQNGVFSFGGSQAMSATGFGGGFEASTQPFANSAQMPFSPPTSNTPGLFSFGGAQSTPIAPSTGGFNFGQSTTTFNADAKPTFNFTGGTTPTFSATEASSTTLQRRKIRAIRRNPQR